MARAAQLVSWVATALRNFVVVFFCPAARRAKLLLRLVFGFCSRGFYLSVGVSVPAMAQFPYTLNGVSKAATRKRDSQ